MKKKNLLWSMLLFGATLIGFSSCSDDDNNNGPTIEAAELPGVYVLNNGTYETNESSLIYNGFESIKPTNLFRKNNGVELGDTGQSMIKYGSKIYVAMYGSKLIYVLDINSKIISIIKNDPASPSEKLEPRELEAYNGKVYVTLFDGYLARIDTTTLSIDKKIAVGLNPEGVKVVNNKVYVANSGGLNWENGYDKTVSIVDLELTTKKDITVAVNPCELKVDKYNNLYLLSVGNYGDVPNTLQQINTTSDAVTVLAEGVGTSIFLNGDKLYLLNKVYVEGVPTSNLAYYDITTKKVVDESFITDATVIKDISLMKPDPSTGNMYILGANGTNNGDVYIFSADGKLKSKFDSGGAFPKGILFVKK